jgi:signal peptidase II
MNDLIKKFIPSQPLKKVYPPIWIGLLILLAVLDLGTKKIMTEELNFKLGMHQLPGQSVDSSMKSLYNKNEQINLVGENGDIAKFRLVFNDRFIFGSGPSAPVVGIFLTFFAIIFLFFYRWHNHSVGHTYAWLLVFSGAIGNFIDKMFVKSITDRSWMLSFGPKEGYVSGVVDFVEVIWFGIGSMTDVPLLSWLSWQAWPTFNLADSYIVVGISLLVLTMGLFATEDKSEKS